MTAAQIYRNALLPVLVFFKIPFLIIPNTEFALFFHCCQIPSKHFHRGIHHNPQISFLVTHYPLRPINEYMKLRFSPSASPDTCLCWTSFAIHFVAHSPSIKRSHLPHKTVCEGGRRRGEPHTLPVLLGERVGLQRMQWWVHFVINL